MALILVDQTADSLTVSWPETPGASRYTLEYRKADEETFVTLSDQLSTTQARKRNLTDENRAGFFFRARASSDGAWQTHSEPFLLLSQEDDAKRLEAPSVSHPGSNQTLLIQWKAAASHDGGTYELQMRENKGGDEWKTIASSLSGTEVKKKNLTSQAGYMFRVRPVKEEEVPFSRPSDPVVAWGLSPGIQHLFRSLENNTLLRGLKQPPVPLEDALGGKEFVLLYASAHWCGPCRQFTPMLSKWYNSQTTKNVEVVFLSADHDENGFRQYYATQPWLAVDYDEDAREELMGYIRVTGIPRLVVLDGRTGKTLVDNAVGQQLDVNQWRALARAKK